MTDRPVWLPDHVREAVGNAARREVLASLDALAHGPDADFDRLGSLAAASLKAPIALLSVVDVERQWFKSQLGFDQAGGTPVDIAFCAHTVAAEGQPWLVVEDATRDPRFKDNPLVTGEQHIRFYAGAPIIVRGQRIGSLCVLDREPRHDLTRAHFEQLVDLAAVAGSLFELKEEARVRARTAAALMKEEWRHALTLEAGKVGSWVWEVNSGEIIANDILRRMYRFDPHQDITARAILQAVEPKHRPLLIEALRAAARAGEDFVAEYRVGKRWLMARGRVYQRDASGKPMVIMGINLDVTETKESADRTRILLRELNHRVKNTLAMIQSLARQSLKRHPNPEEFIDAFSGRLRTLSDAHALLSNRDWLGIGLIELIKLQVLDKGDHLANQIRLQGSDVQLPPDHALGLGLILHELTSNALKYGALATSSGRVSITWTIEDAPDRRLRLSWIERGGAEVSQPEELGLGGKLIERSLAKVLGSTVSLSFLPKGVEAEIVLPLR